MHLFRIPEPSLDEAPASGPHLDVIAPLQSRLRSGIHAALTRLRGRETETGLAAAGRLQVHSALVAGVSAGFAGSDDLDEVLRRAVRATRDALGYFSVKAFLFDEGVAPTDPAAELRVIATAGDGIPSTAAGAYALPVALGLIGRSARRDEVVLVNDVANSADYHRRPGTEAAAASLCVPIRFDGAVIGVLCLESDRVGAFSANDVRTASILADQMALAVSRWRLLRDRAARATEMERLQGFNESIVQGIHEGIVVAEADGTITFANRRFEDMLGYEPGGLIGASWCGLVPANWQATLKSDRRGQRPLESRLLAKDGRELAVHVTAQPREDQAGAIGELLLFTDITARLRAERVARALSEAGLALRPAESEEALRSSLAAEAIRTGLRVVVLLFDAESEGLRLSLASLEPRRLRAAARAFGKSLDGAEVSGAAAVEAVMAANVAEFHRDPGPLVASALPRGLAGAAPKLARLLGIGPTMLAPMSVTGSLVGLVAVSHPDLEESDTATAAAFAHQVATALDRARLHAETERRARQVTVLAGAAQLLAATAELEQLAEAITERVRTVFDGDAASLYIVDSDKGSLELAGGYGYTAEERKVVEQTAGSRHPAWVIEHRRTLLSGDATTDPRIVYLGSRPRFLSVMMVPLVIEGGRCLGALGVSSRRRFAWSPADLRLVSTLSDQVAVAVANALRIREANRRAAQLVRVSEAGHRISAGLATPGLIDRAVAEAAKVFEVTHAAVILVGDDGAITEAAHHPTSDPIFLSADDFSWVADLDGPTVLTNLQHPGPFLNLEMRLVEAGVHSLIVAPLVVQGRSVGGLVLMALEGQRAFGREAHDLAQITADQVAVAVENARLIRDTVDAHQRTEAVVRSSFTAMLTVDPFGRVREANPAAAQLLGAPRESIGGRLLDEALGTDLWLDPDGPIGFARRSGAISPPREEIVALPDGREREVLLGVAPLPDGYLISMADITRLKELDRLKTELVANVSHELRSPLASIKAYTELLLDELVPDSATNLRFLSVIDAQADRLGQCIDNLLDLARVEAEGYVVRPERFDLEPFLREAIEAVAIRAASKEIDVALELPPVAVRLNGDRPILFSSLKNLLDNAVKYSESATKVVVRAEASPRGLTLSIIDQGPGIPAEEWSRIFEKFYRVPSNARNRPEGSGLGLVIARQSARAHGGDVTIDSTIGRGSTFRLFLPADVVEASTEVDVQGSTC